MDYREVWARIGAQTTAVLETPSSQRTSEGALNEIREVTAEASAALQDGNTDVFATCLARIAALAHITMSDIDQADETEGEANEADREGVE
jgi:hypothetical protein